MPRQTEPNPNFVLGELLEGMMGRSHVRSEHTQVIEGQPSLQLDILIIASGRAPVVIESEVMPANDV